MRFIGKHAATIVVAMVTAAVTAGGPALARVVADYAKNSDKVDGFHAVGFGASIAARKGKLVATSGRTGSLPNNIIKKAPNADELDGLNSTAFLRASHLALISARMSMGDPDKTLLKAGPFKVLGRCTAGGGGQIQIASVAKTSENNSAYHARTEGGTVTDDADFDTGGERAIGSFQTVATVPTAPTTATATMVAPSGKRVLLTLSYGAQLLSDTPAQRTDCVFAGYAAVS
jgi:hypothetical protein